MANFTPSAKTAQDFNHGVEYVDGDGTTTGDAIQAESINSVIEGLLYAQGFAVNQPDVSDANQVGTASVSIVTASDGTARLKFSNLQGEAGVGISTIVPNGTDANGGNKYKITLSDGQTYNFVAPKGATGTTGNGISSTVITYATGVSGTTPPATGWQSTIPAVAQGSYLWTRFVFLYTDGSQTTGFSVAYQGVDGQSGGGGGAITSFPAAYDAGYNFNGKEVTFTKLDYSSSDTYQYYEIDFANGYKVHGSFGGGINMAIYNPYGATDDFNINHLNNFPQSYTFRDGTNDIGTNCTITAFKLITSSSTATTVTPSEFQSFIKIEFDGLTNDDVPTTSYTVNYNIEGYGGVRTITAYQSNTAPVNGQNPPSSELELLKEDVRDVGEDTVTLSYPLTVTKQYLYVSITDDQAVTGGVEAIGTGQFKVTGDGTISAKWYCLTGDTLVTMFDGANKRIDEIEVGDKVLSLDFDTMQVVPREVIYTDKDLGKSFVEYDKWTFDDGTVVKTVHRHRFYNAEAQCMKYMDEWNIGEHTYKIDGTYPTFIAHEKVHETVKHYKITLDGSTNYFANGILTGDRYCPKNIVFKR